MNPAPRLISLASAQHALVVVDFNVTLFLPFFCGESLIYSFNSFITRQMRDLYKHDLRYPFIPQFQVTN